MTVPQAESASAAPLTGKLCRDLFNLPKPTGPPRTTMPDPAEIAALGELALDYVNPAEPVRNAALPSDDPAKVRTEFGTKYRGKSVGTEKHLFARWNAWLDKHPELKTKAEINGAFDGWRNSYVTVHDNNARGHALHKLVVEKLGLTGDDWLCEKTLGPKGNQVRVDIVHRRTLHGFEVKAGSGHTPDQLAKYKALVDNKTLSRTTYVHGQEPDKATREALKNAGADSARIKAKPRVTNIQPTLPGGGCATGKVQTLAARCAPGPMDPSSKGQNSKVQDLAKQTGRNPAEARRYQNLQRELGARDWGFRRPGGIDWSTLELSYLEVDPGTGDVGYSFQADDNPDEAANPSFGGEETLDLSSDAFYTWLALPDQVFWVNLNPDHPDQVTDPLFADTKAARVLLEADLEMKRDFTRLTNPETEVGAAYWDSLRTNPDGSVCWPSTRQWIYAAPAKVRQEGDRLYILDAPMSVGKERMEFTNYPDGQEPCTASDEIMDHNFRMAQEHLAPVVERLINTDPKYADLRSVYRARVAAAWVKQRNEANPGPYDAIIDSGDVSLWPEGTGWKTKDVWDDMMENDWTRVQFEVTREEIVDGEPYTWTYPIYGGVELDKSPRKQTPTEEFRRDHPELPRAVQASRVDIVGYGDEDALVGGGTAQEPIEPEPTPTPTPTPTPDDPPARKDPPLVATG
ncbi:hypothetical protein [Promicromonospora sp. NPDC090134]|uniref:hypothetical protein n=1 Tax=Promicromonospora sp. NPDC090134 TaxID=3364408 RepID=UPI003818C8E1